MKYIYYITAFITTTLALFWFPWYVPFIITSMAGIVFRPNRSFWFGFIVIALTWGVLYAWKDIPNQHILSNRMASLFGMPNGFLLLLTGSLIMAIPGGLTCYAGKQFRNLF